MSPVRPACGGWRDLASVALAILLVTLVAPAGASDRVALRVDQVTLASPVGTGVTATRVDFAQTYAQTPAVFILPNEDNPDPATVRILSVDTAGFDVLIAEPPGEDGATVGSTISYFAVEPFARSTGGVEMEAAVVTGFTTQAGRFNGNSTQTINFTRTKNATPVVLAQIQSSNNQPALAPGVNASPWMTMRVLNPTVNGFDVTIERSEDGTSALAQPETIAWFAIDANVDFDFPDAADVSVPARAATTADNIVGHDNGCVTAPFGRTFGAVPHVFGNKQRFDGADGGWLRQCTATTTGVDLVVDEDRINDTERSHTTESAGLVVFERTFTATRQAPNITAKPFEGEVGTALVPASSGATLAFTRVDFPEAFVVTPLIFTLPTEVDPAPATLRVRDVSPTGFEVAAIEPPGESGAHDAMTIDYIAVEPGLHRLDDGRFIEAGSIDTQAFQAFSGGGTSFDSISFTPARFATPPALLTQIQTVANEPGIDPSLTSAPFLTAVNANVTTAGADIALERSEATAGAISVDETIGWLAAETGVHGTLLARDGSTVEYDFSSGTSVAGFDNGCDPVSFTAAFPGTPLAIADKNSRAGNNGGWLRRCTPPAVSATGLGLHVDEDRANDGERSHIDEVTSVLAFERTFDWCPSDPEILLSKTSDTVSDPVNVASNPKALPDAIIDFTISAQNDDKAQTDPDSIVISDQLPEGLTMFVGDLVGGAPFELLQGTQASGLSFDFVAIDDGTDDVAFTDDVPPDPIVYDYQPTPGTDFDPNVTGFQITLDGTFLGQLGADPPSFTLRYRTRLD